MSERQTRHKSLLRRKTNSVKQSNKEHIAINHKQLIPVYLILGLLVIINLVLGGVILAQKCFSTPEIIYIFNAAAA